MSKQQHTQEPVAKVDMSDEGQWADILPDRDVKLGQLLYAFPPDAAARIAELEKQRDTLLAAAQQAANEIRKCDYTPARSTLLTAIASVKEQA